MLPKILHQLQLSFHRISLKHILRNYLGSEHKCPQFFAKLLWQLSIAISARLGTAPLQLTILIHRPLHLGGLRKLCHHRIRLILEPTQLNGSLPLISGFTSVNRFVQATAPPHSTLHSSSTLIRILKKSLLSSFILARLWRTKCACRSGKF